MKKIFILLVCFISVQLEAQELKELKIETVVNEVTVFIEGAQVTRKKAVDLAPGQVILKFVNLSPFIDAKSIQVKAEGELTVLSVNHQQNFIDKLKKPQELTDLENKLKDLEKRIDLEKTYLAILKEELAFLQENRAIGGKNQELNISNLKEASNFYSTKLTEIKLQEIERNNKIMDLGKQMTDIENQISTITGKKEFATGEIMVKVDAKKKITASFEVSYLVGNAGWFPSYDIRVKNIEEPLELIYKANVKQDTKVDWENVKLKFSSADPKISGVAPKLKMYFLDYDNLPPVYNTSINQVTGKVMDSDNRPLPGTTVIVKGTTIGTVTDIDGNYSLTIPQNSDYLTFSFVGCKSQTNPINSEIINVIMEEDIMALEEVVAIGYGVLSDDLTGSVFEDNDTPPLKVKKSYSIRGAKSLTLPSEQIQKQTSVDFEIKTPYTIKSDNKSYNVDMVNYQVPAYYQYYCVPKIDHNAFLIANITDWEQLSLLEGEANIFFEDTYIGKSIMDVRYSTDTLKISLGQDKNVSINREKMKDFTTRQFIGNKKEETRTWKTTIKNNKSQKINILILDQVPVPTLEEIEVEVSELSGANQNKETGEIKWELTLDPNEKKELELKYSVKYPKFKNLIVE